jgi:hypothetical protein
VTREIRDGMGRFGAFLALAVLGIPLCILGGVVTTDADASRFSQQVVANITNGSSTSNSIPLEGVEKIGVWVPTIDNGTFAIELGEGGGNFYPVRDQTGAQVGTWAASTGLFYLDGAVLDRCLGARYMRFKTGVNQTALRQVVVNVWQ